MFQQVLIFGGRSFLVRYSGGGDVIRVRFMRWVAMVMEMMGKPS